MTIDDFKIGTLIEHNEWGDGEVIANNGYNKIAVDFTSGAKWCLQSSNPLDITSALKIKQFKEKTMQEFEPITKDNIEEVLEYNGWKYDGKEYNNYKSTEDGFIIDCNISLGNDFKYNLCNFNGNINTNNFNEFLAFVQKRITLNPLPKKPEFDFNNYMSINAKNMDYIPNQFDNTFKLYFDAVDYAQTKKNADILIAAAKLLEGLK
jgi:hypothetical protein